MCKFDSDSGSESPIFRPFSHLSGGGAAGLSARIHPSFKTCIMMLELEHALALTTPYPHARYQLVAASLRKSSV